MPRTLSSLSFPLRSSRKQLALLAIVSAASLVAVPDDARASDPVSSTAGRQAQRRRRRHGQPTTTTTPEPAAPGDTEMAGATPTTPTQAPPPAAATTEPEAPVAHPSRPIALDAFVGFRGIGRSLSYVNDMTNTFRGYDLGFGPSVYAAVEWFPGAHFTSSALAHIGIYGDFGAAFGIVSQDSAGTSYGTGSILYDVGLRGRFPLVSHLDLGVRVGYGGQTYSISSSMGQPPGVPDVSYGFIRFGVSARYDLAERVGILVGLNYLLTLNAGQFTSGFFPHESINGFEGSVAVAVRIIGGLEARVGFDARVFWHSFSAMDMNAVQSATDLFYGITIGAAYRF